MPREIKGTREWSTASQNICTGCSHQCRYCYASHDAVNRSKKVASYDDWATMNIQTAAMDKPAKKVTDGSVMFPTTHDITPEILGSCVSKILEHLELGNKLLIVSKPHLSCIEEICNQCFHYTDQLMFRFSIGAFRSCVLRLWEPGAPSYHERAYCLQYAQEQGFQTSVSCEPMLDSYHVVNLFLELEPHITHSFWIGKMNHIDTRVQDCIPPEEIARIRQGQTDERIRAIYNELRDEPKVHWKESFRKVLGLDLMQTAGEDE